MGIRESVHEEASHQLVAIWSGRHGTETVGNCMHQEIADTVSISPKQTRCGAWNLLASFKNGKRGKSNVRKPYVVRAVIDLGFCLDLISSTGHPCGRKCLPYCNTAAVPVPENTGGQDALFRKLDCAIINHLHKVRDAAELPAFDSVKGVFIEDDPIYPKSGFNRKTISRFALEASNASGVSFESRTIG